jgi:hypothetical protein
VVGSFPALQSEPALKSKPATTNVISVDSDDEIQPMDIDLPEGKEAGEAHYYDDIEYSPSVRKNVATIASPNSGQGGIRKGISCFPLELSTS